MTVLPVSADSCPLKHLLLLALLLAAAPTAADADVTIELLLRERQDARDAGAIGVPIGGMLVMVPTRETVKAIRVELRAGDATRVFDAANRTFGRAAKSLAEQIQSWCADNRAQLESVPEAAGDGALSRPKHGSRARGVCRPPISRFALRVP
jgi:hypothetical protein